MTRTELISVLCKTILMFFVTLWKCCIEFVIINVRMLYESFVLLVSINEAQREKVLLEPF